MRVRDKCLLNCCCAAVRGVARSWGMSTRSRSPLYAESPTANQRLSASASPCPAGKMGVARRRSMSRGTPEARHREMSCFRPTMAPNTASRRPLAPVHTWNLRPWPLRDVRDGGGGNGPRVEGQWKRVKPQPSPARDVNAVAEHIHATGHPTYL